MQEGNSSQSVPLRLTQLSNHCLLLLEHKEVEKTDILLNFYIVSGFMHCMPVCLGVLLMTCFHVTDDLTVRIISGLSVFFPFFPLLKKCKSWKTTESGISHVSTIHNEQM